jgi:hypothetical protein
MSVRGEDFERGLLLRDNKTTVIGGSCEARIAIFAEVSTRLGRSTIFRCAP